MLSSLPKLADRNFVLGFLVPMLVFTLAGLALYHDVGPFKTAWDATLEADSWTKLTLLAVGVTVGAILLFVGNHALYQLLEGYRGPFNRSGWRREMRGEFDKASKHLEALHERMGRAGKTADVAGREYLEALAEFYERFPYEKDAVLPTRFGNVIRAFETYSVKIYGVDGISAWFRMAGVVPKSMQALVDNARAEVDLFVNLWFLALAFAAVAMIRIGVWVYDMWPVVRLETPAWIYIAVTVLALGTARASYEAGITRARAWGGLVKSVFDLYLPSLAKQLGYRLPDTQVDRARFWNEVSTMFLYLEPLAPEKWPRADPQGAVDAPAKESTSDEKESNGAVEEDDE